eukprot:768751-Hanusia_phi.AAC.2
MLHAQHCCASTLPRGAETQCFMRIALLLFNTVPPTNHLLSIHQLLYECTNCRAYLTALWFAFCNLCFSSSFPSTLILCRYPSTQLLFSFQFIRYIVTCTVSEFSGINNLASPSHVIEL